MAAHHGDPKKSAGSRAAMVMQIAVAAEPMPAMVRNSRRPKPPTRSSSSLAGLEPRERASAHPVLCVAVERSVCVTLLPPVADVLGGCLRGAGAVLLGEVGRRPVRGAVGKLLHRFVTM